MRGWGDCVGVRAEELGGTLAERKRRKWGGALALRCGGCEEWRRCCLDGSESLSVSTTEFRWIRARCREEGCRGNGISSETDIPWSKKVQQSQAVACSVCRIDSCRHRTTLHDWIDAESRLCHDAFIGSFVSAWFSGSFIVQS